MQHFSTNTFDGIPLDIKRRVVAGDGQDEVVIRLLRGECRPESLGVKEDHNLVLWTATRDLKPLAKSMN